MADEDIFGKIDALLEKRAGFGTTPTHPPSEDDFPLLTEVVEPQRDTARADCSPSEQQAANAGKPDVATTQVSMSEEQFNRLLSSVERKLEDLFIRQQLRIEEAIRRALQRTGDTPRRGASDAT